MADTNESPLSADERAELERLRAAQAAAAEANQARVEREELERLRKSQKYAEEDARHYAEKQRRREERERARENPDYSVDDLPPMPTKQKVVLGVVAAAVVVLVAYLVWFNAGGQKTTDATSGEVVAASSQADASQADAA